MEGRRRGKGRTAREERKKRGRGEEQPGEEETKALDLDPGQ